jgi:excisionase family DNA binding protein
MTIDPDQLYTAAELAEILRCGTTNAYELLSSGAIPATRIGSGGRGLRARGADILAFLDARRRPMCPCEESTL